MQNKIRTNFHLMPDSCIAQMLPFTMYLISPINNAAHTNSVAHVWHSWVCLCLGRWQPKWDRMKTENENKRNTQANIIEKVTSLPALLGVLMSKIYGLTRNLCKQDTVNMLVFVYMWVSLNLILPLFWLKLITDARMVAGLWQNGQTKEVESPSKNKSAM